MLTKNIDLPRVSQGYLPNSLEMLSRIHVEDTMRPAKELRQKVQREKMRAFCERRENTSYGMLKEDEVGVMANLHTKLQELRMKSGKTKVNVTPSAI